jgi:hypothetical protein
MAEAKRVFEEKVAGWIIVGTSSIAMILMLHHPSTLSGPDDGLFLPDWSNAFVHTAMLGCLMLLIFAFSILADRINEYSLLGRAGGLAFTGGIVALAVAAAINGFVLSELLAALPDWSAATPQMILMGVVVRGLALGGMSLASLGIACWSIVLLRRDLVTKVCGVLGLGLTLAAGWWLAVEQGNFGLYPAVYSVAGFAIWSLIVANQMIRGRL